ncbi:hypothetical protein ABT282_07255 [Streptomyces sp. NPDC000927]|uniref:hypothetical protein n=1 Tax=Streptomyces sp. NPDC000927 TaxID=3154371 RepID=UPI00333233B0
MNATFRMAAEGDELMELITPRITPAQRRTLVAMLDAEDSGEDIPGGIDKGTMKALKGMVSTSGLTPQGRRVAEYLEQTWEQPVDLSELRRPIFLAPDIPEEVV